MNIVKVYGEWQLEYVQETGRMVRLQRRGFPPVTRQNSPTLTFEVEGVSVHNDQMQMFTLVNCTTIAESSRLFDLEEKDNKIIFSLSLERDWFLTQQFTFESDWVCLDACLRYEGSVRQRLRSATHEVLSGGSAEREELFAPGYTLTSNQPFDLHRPISDYMPGELLSHGLFGDSTPAYRPGIIGAHDAMMGRTVCTWWDNETLLSYPLSLCYAGGLRRQSRIQMPRFMSKGDCQNLGTFYYGAFTGDRQSALCRAMSSFDSHHWAKEAPNARNLRIMEIHIGEKAGRTVFTSYDQIIEKLHCILHLGFNAIQIMPAMPFPTYSVHDMTDVQTTYHDADGLRRLIEQAHAMDLRVIIDMVFHGPQDYVADVVHLPPSPYLTQAADWFSRHESGAYARTYTRSFDLANKDYQRHIQEVMLYYLDTLHPDGFRLDAQMWNEFPNWDETTGRMPYESISAGLLMMDEIRAAVHTQYPDTIFYTEANGPMTGRAHDYRYNYDMHWIYPALCPVTDPRGASRHTQNLASQGTLTWPDLALWLSELQSATPKGLTIVHQVDSHDSCEWSGFPGGQFNREAFGMDAHHALLCMVTFFDGALMSYYGAQQGSEDYYHSLIPLRNLPIFANGHCHYTAITSDDPKTCSILWEDGQSAVVCICNLQGMQKRVRLFASPDLLPDKPVFAVRELLTGQDYGQMDSLLLNIPSFITLEPFQSLVFTLA